MDPINSGITFLPRVPGIIVMIGFVRIIHIRFVAIPIFPVVVVALHRQLVYHGPNAFGNECEVLSLLALGPGIDIAGERGDAVLHSDGDAVPNSAGCPMPSEPVLD